MRPSRLNQVLNSVADAGRELLRRGAPAGRLRERSPGVLCEALLSTRGEASGTALARDVADAYRAMSPAQKHAFFATLAADYGPDPAAIHAASDGYKAAPGCDTLMALSAAVEPPRQELFRRINMAPNGTATIVAMREDLLTLLPDDPSLKAVDIDLVHLLTSWFNRGFLHLEQIDWESPAALLQKIMAYEAVHPMAGWADLKRRLAEDRRCFAFFHPALPDEPLIFVEVALVRGMASAVQPLIAGADEPLDPARADTAIFYAINNCRDGLVGISFGNFLIKQVVVELARELPSLKTFATLSPIPGFRAWLATQAGNGDGARPAEEAAAIERVWTPPLMQAVFGRLGACGQVLSCVRPLYAADATPRARMEIRGLGPNRLRELESSPFGCWFSQPGLVDLCPYLSSVLPTSPTASRTSPFSQAVAGAR